jgi:hypothetical protein
LRKKGNVKDRLLIRFDTVVAVCALLASSIAAGAMVYQTHVIEEQFSAAIWPYVSVSVTNSEKSVAVRMTNEGAGPALIRSARLILDGKPVDGWNALLQPLYDNPVLNKGRFSAQTSSVNGSDTLRPGDSISLVTLQSANADVIAAAKKHRVTLQFCYCSINDRCWNLNDTLGSNIPDIPQQVNGCAAGASIAAEPLKLRGAKR